MKRLFFAACGLLFLGACAALVPDNNSNAVAGGVYNADGVFVAYCSDEPAPVMFTKEGFPIIDDQACIPEPEVLGIQVSEPDKTCKAGKKLVGNVCLPHRSNRSPPDEPQECTGDLVGEAPDCNCPEGQVSTGGDTCEVPQVCTGDLVGEAPDCNCPEGEVSTGGDTCDEPQECTGDLVGEAPDCNCPEGEVSTGGDTCESEPDPVAECLAISGGVVNGNGQHCQGPINWTEDGGSNDCPLGWSYQSISVCTLD